MYDAPSPRSSRQPRRWPWSRPARPASATAPARLPTSDDVLRQYAADTWRSFEAMAVPSTGPAVRQRRRRPERRQPQRLHLAHQHRRLPLVDRRRPRHRADRRRRGARAPRADPRVGRAARAARAQRHVLQLVRPDHAREAPHLARERQHGQAVPLQRRQRLAGHGAAADRARRAVAGRRGRRDPRGHGLRLLLRRGREPDPRRLLGRGPAARPRRSRATTAAWARTSGTPATTTARSTPSRGWRRTSGIASGQIPTRHYYGTFRTFAPTCDWSWTETKPVGEWKTYDGERVFEGALPYRGMKIVPTWGGSMFEALMVPLFVPEETWGPKSWGRNHPLYVKAQIQHGLERRAVRLLGLLAVQQPGGRLPRVRRGRARPRRRRLHQRPGPHRLGPVLRRLRPQG